jgi:hypothetical protein
MANGGYRGYEAIWEGGASATPPVVVAGYRSYEAIWLGGAAGYASVTPPIPPTPLPEFGGGGGISYDEYRRRKRKKGDEEILFL